METVFLGEIERDAEHDRNGSSEDRQQTYQTPLQLLQGSPRVVGPVHRMLAVLKWIARQQLGLTRSKNHQAPMGNDFP
jgi:hypothetical protein